MKANQTLNEASSKLVLESQLGGLALLASVCILKYGSHNLILPR
jgi:hypothetical protein